MDSVYSILLAMGTCAADVTANHVDILSNLPVELAFMILRMLEPSELLVAAHVNNRWLGLCRSDSTLRTRIRKEIRRQKRAMFDNLGGQVARVRQQGIQPRGLATTNNVQHQVLSDERPVAMTYVWPSKEEAPRVSRHSTRATRRKAVPYAKPRRKVKETVKTMSRLRV